MATTTTHLSLTKQVGTEGSGTSSGARLTVLNANWDIVDALFHGSTGHSHDGTSGDGPKIGLDGFNRGTTAGTVLTSNGTGSNPSYQSIPGPTLDVRNETGGTLAAGTLVYASSWNETHTRFLIVKADADVAGAEALFVLTADLTNNTNGTAGRSHRLTSQNTSGLTVGNPVYVHTTAGSWTATAPVTADDLQQSIGRVAVVDSSSGVVEINLDAGQTLKIGSNQLQNDSVGLAAIAAQTQGNVLYYGASGNPAVLAPGTDGFFLKTTGASSDPVWAAAGGGKIQQVGFSAAISGNTTSTSFADITNGNVSLDVTKGGLIAVWHLAGYSNGVSSNNYFALQLDSDSEGGQVRYTQPIANQDQTMAGVYRWTSVSTATHRVDMRMKVSADTFTLREGHIMLMEFDD